MIELVANGINAMLTKNSIKKDNEVFYIGDGGIDIFRHYKGMHFIMQAKFRTNKESYVAPKDVKEFIAVLIEQHNNTVEFFVSNAKFLIRTQTYTNNSRVKIILCDEKNLIEKIKEV